MRQAATVEEDIEEHGVIRTCKWKKLPAVN